MNRESGRGDDTEEERAKFEAQLEQWERKHEQFEREIRELDRLASEGTKEEKKIANGIDTSAAQLDRYLRANMAFYHWSAQHPLDPLPGELPGKPSDREEMGIEYLKLQKVLSGSYHQEKADYCHEMYVFHRGKAEESEQELAAGAGTLDLEPGVEDRVRQRIGKSRSWAANWLRTEANCLEMPDSQNDLTALPPQQTDH